MILGAGIIQITLRKWARTRNGPPFYLIQFAKSSALKNADEINQDGSVANVSVHREPGTRSTPARAPNSMRLKPSNAPIPTNRKLLLASLPAPSPPSRSRSPSPRSATRPACRR